MLRKKTQALCVVTSLLLVLSLATASFSLPLPMLAVSRTQVMPTVKSGVAWPDAQQIEGAVVHFEDFAVTTSTDSTAAMYIGGLVPWRVINESGAAATLTFYDARSVNGTALSLIDQDDIAVPSITIGDDESQELPSSMAGCTYLVVTGAAAADGFTVVCKR